MTPIQQIAFGMVEEITETKRGAVAPCVAHIDEIRKAVNIELVEALRELCRLNLISVSLDKNKNPMFSIQNPQDK